MSFTALFYVEQRYAFGILRPLQAEIKLRGGAVHWLLVGDEIDECNLLPDEQCVPNAEAAVALNPAAVFVPGDRVPSFIPGLKVQVFHGLNEDKRGNVYPERGLFDLYCTEGPGRTGMLKPLAAKRKYFQVRETGWLKLDSLLHHEPAADNGTYVEPRRPTILFASTFTPRLSCAESLYAQIKTMTTQDKWQWLVTLHPKMAASTVAKYEGLTGPNLDFCYNDQVFDAMHRADVMVCDNSSILQEFLILNKPVVTFNNRAPQSCLINIDDPAQLEGAITTALNPTIDLKQAIKDYGPSVTPYLDGQSAARVYQAALEMLESDWTDTKPVNLWRNWKMRRQLGYFKFF